MNEREVGVGGLSRKARTQPLGERLDDSGKVYNDIMVSEAQIACDLNGGMQAV